MHHIGCLILLCMLVVVTGCNDRSQEPEAKTAKDCKQEVTALTDVDQQRLRNQRAVVEKFLTNEDSRKNYQTADGKLRTIRDILQANVFKPNQTYELQCLGIVLGDVFVQELKLAWVIVEDEYGRDPAVRFPATSIILFPLTMISKRVERSEQVDVFELFNGVAAMVDDVRRRGG